MSRDNSIVTHVNRPVRSSGIDRIRKRRRLRVECLEDRRLLAADYGDAPDLGVGVGVGNYQTLLSDNGPSHTLPDTGLPALFVGTTVDADPGILQNIRANADDVDGSLPDDEDGVLDPLDLRATIGAAPVITVSATNSSGEQAILAGWIDYNQNGVFEPEERATTTVNTGSIHERVLLEFPTIASGLAGHTYARLRISSDAAFIADPTPIGAVSNGEVEDYQFVITARSNGLVNSSVKLASGLNGVPAIPTNNLYHAPANLGDFDGDGIDDLVVTSRGLSGQNQPGSVYIHRMNADGTVRETTSFSISVPNFGTDVDAIGDLNGDGVTDIVVGSDMSDGGRGAAFVIFLNSDGSMQSNVKIGTNLNGGPPLTDDELFGSSVAAMGDHDGDGVPDVLVGTVASAYVVFLNSDGTAREFIELTDGLNGIPSGTIPPGSAFGYRSDVIGDLNNDGISELAIFARGTDGQNLGTLHILFLSKDGTAIGHKLLAQGDEGMPNLSAGDYFGRGVSVIDDLDGDGIRELVVGAMGDDTGGQNRGAFYVLFMKSDGSVSRHVKIAAGLNGGPLLADGDSFGDRIAPIGDLDGDGISELAVLAVNDDTGNPNQGAMHVLFFDPVGVSIIQQDFDSVGSSYSLIEPVVDGTHGVLAGGPAGNYFRLNGTTSNSSKNGQPDLLLFDDTLTVAGHTIHARFDYRETKYSSGGSEGIRFTLYPAETISRVSDAYLGHTLPYPIDIGRGFPDVLHVHFDTFNNAQGHPDPAVVAREPNANHLEVNYNSDKNSSGWLISETVPFDINDADWHTVDLNLRPDGADALLTLTATAGTTTHTIIDDLKIPAFLFNQDYRAALWVDYGAAISLHDIDNILIETKAANATPTLDPISDLTIDEDAAEQTINLAGIGAGPLESQSLRVTATSDNTGLILDPTVTYTSANPTGSLAFTPVADQSGTATITVTVEDAGLDNDLATTVDNATFSRTFDIVVNPVNDDPTLDSLDNLTIDEDAAAQTVNLAGITAGADEAQTLKVTAISGNTGLIPDPTVSYTSANPTGSLAFKPIADQYGTATITVTVEDAGLDND
ncbi:FG-GAP-like repeat-containing protein, partial [bacterium]|nr:FG-GAP-like repeat-containing protein [bacterium]